MSPQYTTVGGYPNTDPYYISPEEEAEMEKDHLLNADVIAAARRLDKSSLHDYAVKGLHHFPNDARLVARALLAAIEQEGVDATRDGTNPSADLEHLSAERRRGLEEAAMIADDHARAHRANMGRFQGASKLDIARSDAAKVIADDIRALIPPSSEGGEEKTDG